MEDLAVYSVDSSSATIATSSPASSSSTPETTSLLWNKSQNFSYRFDAEYRLKLNNNIWRYWRLTKVSEANPAYVAWDLSCALMDNRPYQL